MSFGAQSSPTVRRRDMAENNSRRIFVNVPVRDLSRSMEFLRRLGFDFNPQFTDDEAACMVVSGEAFVMLPNPSSRPSPGTRSATRAALPRVCSRSPAEAGRKSTK
jgi:hypothetical protein